MVASDKQKDVGSNLALNQTFFKLEKVEGRPKDLLFYSGFFRHFGTFKAIFRKSHFSQSFWFLRFSVKRFFQVLMLSSLVVFSACGTDELYQYLWKRIRFFRHCALFPKILSNRPTRFAFKKVLYSFSELSGSPFGLFDNLILSCKEKNFDIFSQKKWFLMFQPMVKAFFESYRHSFWYFLVL